MSPSSLAHCCYCCGFHNKNAHSTPIVVTLDDHETKIAADDDVPMAAGCITDGGPLQPQVYTEQAKVIRRATDIWPAEALPTYVTAFSCKAISPIDVGRNASRDRCTYFFCDTKTNMTPSTSNWPLKKLGGDCGAILVCSKNFAVESQGNCACVSAFRRRNVRMYGGCANAGEYVRARPTGAGGHARAECVPRAIGTSPGGSSPGRFTADGKYGMREIR